MRAIAMAIMIAALLIRDAIRTETDAVFIQCLVVSLFAFTIFLVMGI